MAKFLSKTDVGLKTYDGSFAWINFSIPFTTAKGNRNERAQLGSVGTQLFPYKMSRKTWEV